MFSASFTDLSVGVQTAASAPFVCVTGNLHKRRSRLEDPHSTVRRYARRCSSFWQEQDPMMFISSDLGTETIYHS